MWDVDAEFRRMARRISQERNEACEVIRTLLVDPSPYVGAPLPPEWITAGMAFELADAANNLRAESPARSASLAELATIVAASLDDDYPAVTRMQAVAGAWKEVANAHRYRSNYESALAALQRADRAVQDEPALAHDRAVLAFARATTLGEINRLPEALVLLDEALDIFDSHGDQHRIAQCELLRGMIHQRQGDGEEARAAYRRALAGARKIGDAHTAGSALSNLGVLNADHGRPDEALDAFQQARAIFTDLGAHAEVARAAWGIGFALLASGRYTAAIPMLREARQQLRLLSLSEEAGIAGVDLVHAYLAVQQYDAARRLLVAVIEEFRPSGLNERALVALKYLHDAVPEARPETARHVRTYLSRLREEPARLFLPPDWQ
jgi:tetratricopeptide (TPR) repeat protein